MSTGTFKKKKKKKLLSNKPLKNQKNLEKQNK